MCSTDSPFIPSKITQRFPLFSQKISREALGKAHCWAAYSISMKMTMKWTHDTAPVILLSGRNPDRTGWAALKREQSGKEEEIRDFIQSKLFILSFWASVFMTSDKHTWWPAHFLLLNTDPRRNDTRYLVGLLREITGIPVRCVFSHIQIG